MPPRPLSSDCDLESLYRTHANALMALAFRLTGSSADAEDVLHDVFLGLPEAMRHYEERGSMASWLKRLTVRVALTRMRGESRRREDSLDLLPEPARDGDASRLGDREALASALAALPDTLRAVFVLREVEGCSHSEIAALLDISAGASAVRLSRAIRQLRLALEQMA